MSGNLWARRALEGIAPYVPGKPAEELERELGIPKAIKLASNENPLGPSPKAVAAIREALGDLHRYPDGACTALTVKLAERFRVGPQQVVVGNGSDELITLAARAFLEPGDEVVVAEPTFLIYRIAAQVAGVRVRAVPLRSFRYDLPAMRRAVSGRTKLVFVANPDNPTGTYQTRAELETFLSDLPERTVLFLDQAYAECVEAPDYPEGRDYLERHAVIVTRTFSKAYGLSGIRVGYGLAPRQLADALHRVREPFNVNRLAQVAAAAALDDAEHLEATRRLLTEQKPVLYSALRELAFEPIPSAANFILFRAGARAGRIAEALLRRGIIVRHMKAWKLPEHIRVTVGTPEENAAFIQALKEVAKT